MVNDLIEKCDCDIHAEVMDSCELFKMKIVSFWDEFMYFSRMNVSLSDMEPNARDGLASNDGINWFPPINTSDDSYNEPVLHDADNEVPNISSMSKNEIADTLNEQV